MQLEETSVSLNGGFELLQERPPEGLFRRFFVTLRHLLGLIFGGGFAYVRHQKAQAGAGNGKASLLRFVLFFVKPFLNKNLITAPFPVQLRRRLEILGPTYIKLGQILSLREDILPQSVTNELKNLLDRLPVVTFERYTELIEAELKQSVDTVFSWIDPAPLGSASIAQIHRARLLSGEEVVIKVVKPGIRETILRDSKLLRFFGAILQFFLGQYQPKRVVDEFCDYTLREVDLRLEGDNAETFAANFRDEPNVHFPTIYRDFSSRGVLCMEFFDGIKPDEHLAEKLTAQQRSKLINLGSSAIIRMLYQDGFFHADLHPGNLLVLDGAEVGFIDLGMVGRFDDDIRKSMMGYYYSLVMGDAVSAARFLTSVAYPGRGSDPKGFRRAVEDISRRWARAANFKDFSLARLIMESVVLSGQYRMYFPVEMILMVKALVTFEGVGNLLQPGFDVAVVSQKHIRTVLLRQFNPLGIVKETLPGMPELIDTVIRSPMVLAEAFRLLERTVKNPTPNPLIGIKGTMFAGFCLVAGAIVASFDGPWPVWGALFLLAIIVAIRA